mgnify:CR=1 FL=1
MPLPLFEYQEVGAAFLAGRHRAGLFDEMGLGKSAQAVRATDHVKGRRGAVIAPAGVRQIWRGEFEKFGLTRRSVIKAMNIHDFYAWQRGRFDVLVMSYEHAVKWAPYFDQAGEIIDFVIIDEGHYCKNSETARTKAIIGDLTGRQVAAAGGICKWASHAWILTGTPMANDPLDIYPFLRFTACMPLPEATFKSRYFSTFKKTFGERNTPRPDIVDELKRLIQNNSLRRTLKEVGIQLPPIFLMNTTLDGDHASVTEFLREFPGLDIAILQAIQSGGLSFLDSQHIATLRRLVGEAKALPYAQLLYEELVNCTEKYVVIGVHRKALQIVRDHLIQRGIHCVLVQGGAAERERVASQEAFQNLSLIHISEPTRPY